ncbi:MAG: glutathione S-transferase family protein [Marinovum sp.]|nr:glutathione S-transferase family protein [Marinovum sp.]MDG2230414.1 glutathione S-transferase family protein [Paracoccaceae bacterium]
MSQPMVLYSYRYSVYCWIVRLTLAEKRLSFVVCELNPFDKDQARFERSPFGLVPVLEHGAFTLYESAAICRYIDLSFPDPALVPKEPMVAAQMAQAINIIDAHGYQPMIRQVFAHRVFRPIEGLEACEDEIASGLAASVPVLKALEALCGQGFARAGGQKTLADCHLAPMFGYFSQTEEGAKMVASYPKLAQWCAQLKDWQTFCDTTPKIGVAGA